MVVALIKDEILVSINTIEMLGIIYLAIAISKMREHIARLEGKLEQREHNEARESSVR